MNKSLIYALLAACSLTGPASAAQLSDDQGNWSIVLNLNTTAMQNLIKKEAGLDNEQGVNLVSWSGSADYAYNSGANVGHSDNRSAAYWIGWGDDYFPTAATGMGAGFQMGFAGGDGAQANDALITNKPDLDTGIADIANAGYYRAHTREDLNGNFKQDYEGEGRPSLPAGVANEGAGTMDNASIDAIHVDNLASITSATLVLVHNNNNGSVADGGNGYAPHSNGKPHSQTMQYLTISGTYVSEWKRVHDDWWDLIGHLEPVKWEEFTLTFIAEVDDQGSTNPGGTLGEYLPGSNRYDVDIMESITVNRDYVDSFLVSSDALTSEQVKDLVINGVIPNVTFTIPEPTSATLSMMALTALCARRRRRK